MRNHREDVEAAGAAGTAVVALEEQPAVAFADHAQDARLCAELVVERTRVEARTGLCGRNGEQQRRRSCGRRYSESSSAHSDIGT